MEEHILLQEEALQGAQSLLAALEEDLGEVPIRVEIYTAGDTDAVIRVSVRSDDVPRSAAFNRAGTS